MTTMHADVIAPKSGSNQARVWTTARGQPIRIDQLENRHLCNCLAFTLRRSCKRAVKLARQGELRFIVVVQNPLLSLPHWQKVHHRFDSLRDGDYSKWGQYVRIVQMIDENDAVVAIQERDHMVRSNHGVSIWSWEEYSLPRWINKLTKGVSSCLQREILYRVETGQLDADEVNRDHG